MMPKKTTEIEEKAVDASVSTRRSTRLQQNAPTPSKAVGSKTNSDNADSTSEDGSIAERRKTRRSSTDQDIQPSGIRTRRGSQLTEEEKSAASGTPGRRGIKTSEVASPMVKTPARRTTRRSSAQENETVEEVVSVRRSARRRGSTDSETQETEVIVQRPVGRRRRSTSVESEENVNTEPKSKTKKLYTEDNILEPIAETNLSIIDETEDAENEKILKQLDEAVGLKRASPKAKTAEEIKGASPKSRPVEEVNETSQVEVVKEPKESPLKSQLTEEGKGASPKLIEEGKGTSPKPKPIDDIIKKKSIFSPVTPVVKPSKLDESLKDKSDNDIKVVNNEEKEESKSTGQSKASSDFLEDDDSVDIVLVDEVFTSPSSDKENSSNNIQPSKQTPSGKSSEVNKTNTDEAINGGATQEPIVIEDNSSETKDTDNLEKIMKDFVDQPNESYEENVESEKNTSLNPASPSSVGIGKHICFTELNSSDTTPDNNVKESSINLNKSKNEGNDNLKEENTSLVVEENAEVTKRSKRRRVSDGTSFLIHKKLQADTTPKETDSEDSSNVSTKLNFSQSSENVTEKSFNKEEDTSITANVSTEPTFEECIAEIKSKRELVGEKERYKPKPKKRLSQTNSPEKLESSSADKSQLHEEKSPLKAENIETDVQSPVKKRVSLITLSTGSGRKGKSLQTPSPSKRNFDKRQSISAEISTKIDQLLKGFNTPPEDEESDDEVNKNDFIDDMAEEGEEDTPSEDSNQIIDEGESLGSDSFVEEEEPLTDDSFIVNDDDVDMELLSGNEYDLDMSGTKSSPKKKQILHAHRQRILQPSSSDDEVAENTKTKNVSRRSKSPKEDQLEKRLSGNTPAQLADAKSPNIDQLKKNLLENRLSGISSIQKADPNVSIDKEETKRASPTKLISTPNSNYGRPSMGMVSPLKQKTQIEASVQNVEDDHDRSLGDKSKDDGTANTSKLDSSAKSSSIIMQQNFSIEELQEGTLTNQMVQMVNLFCDSIKPKEGNVLLNLSLDYVEDGNRSSKVSPRTSGVAPKSPSTADKSGNTSLDKSQHSIQDVFDKSKESEETTLQSSIGSLTDQTLPTNSTRRKSGSTDQTENDSISGKRKVLTKKKVRLTLMDVSDIERSSSDEEFIQPIPEKRKLPDLKTAAEPTPSKILKLPEFECHSLPDNDLRHKLASRDNPQPNTKELKQLKSKLKRETSKQLLAGLVTDVNDRPRRLLKPSVRVVSPSWKIEDVSLQPSKSNPINCDFGASKINPKDFRNQMIYDGTRNKREATSKLLKRKGHFV